MDIRAKLALMQLVLPKAPKPVAAYLPAVRSGGLLFVSGQLPFREGVLVAGGPVPSRATIEQAVDGARQCALNSLAIIDDQIQGDWSEFVRIVRVGIFVCSDDRFTEQPRVANAASELFVQVFGDSGKHARAAVGVNALPLGATVELELVAELR